MQTLYMLVALIKQYLIQHSAVTSPIATVVRSLHNCDLNVKKKVILRYNIQ